MKYYNHHSKPENGNFNIIAPSKFIAFNGPYFARVDLRGVTRIMSFLLLSYLFCMVKYSTEGTLLKIT